MVCNSCSSKLSTYDDVLERVAQQLDLDDPSKSRLTTHNCYSQQPKPQPIRFRGVDHLSDMLIHYNQVHITCFYLFKNRSKFVGIFSDFWKWNSIMCQLFNVLRYGWLFLTDFWHLVLILYYEILDIPLPELRGLKTLKVSFHHSTKDAHELCSTGHFHGGLIGESSWILDTSLCRTPSHGH